MMENLGNFYSDSAATPALMERSMSNVATVAESFAMNYTLKTEGKCIDTFYPATVFPKDSHRIYAVQAHVCSKLFHQFEIESFGIHDGCTKFLDITEERARNFDEYSSFDGQTTTEALEDPSFKKFWESKLKEAFPKGLHKELKLLFADVAKAVWVLHKLAFSFNPRATILRLDKGRNYDTRYMKSVVNLEEDCNYDIAFVVQPGFRVREQVFQSLIYPTFNSTSTNNDSTSKVKSMAAMNGALLSFVCLIFRSSFLTRNSAKSVKLNTSPDALNETSSDDSLPTVDTNAGCTIMPSQGKAKEDSSMTILGIQDSTGIAPLQENVHTTKQAESLDQPAISSTTQSV